jgi:hypothetical protein
MADQFNDSEKNDEELRQEFEDAVEHIHPEESAPDDPFSTDALGNEPAEEDDSGSV